MGTFLVVTLGEGEVTTSIWRVEARDANKNPTVHRNSHPPPPNKHKKYLSQNVTSAKAKKYCQVLDFGTFSNTTQFFSKAAKQKITLHYVQRRHKWFCAKSLLSCKKDMALYNPWLHYRSKSLILPVIWQSKVVGYKINMIYTIFH